MNNKQDYIMVTKFNCNPSKEFVLPNSTKNRTFLNQKLGINIMYKLHVLFRFDDDIRISKL